MRGLSTMPRRQEAVTGSLGRIGAGTERKRCWFAPGLGQRGLGSAPSFARHPDRVRARGVSGFSRQATTAARPRLTADDVLTAPEVAVIVHAPVSTVEDWARRGILPSVKIGKRRLYIRERIEAVLFEQSAQSSG
jgi:hypothetical protein